MRLNSTRPFRKIPRPALALAAVALLIFACDQFDREDLTDRTTAPAQGPSCSSCHAYPLNDLHHYYHLFNADTLRITKNINGRITCVDCHRGSMAVQVHVLIDSICADSLKPSGWSSLEEGEDFKRCMAANPLLRVDSIGQNRPIPLPPRPGDVPLLEEWMTGRAHMNGTVDVDLDPRVDNLLEDPRGAQWDPQFLTCSAVACHEHEGHYRWASPSRGLEGLRGHHGGSGAP